MKPGPWSPPVASGPCGCPLGGAPGACAMRCNITDAGTSPTGGRGRGGGVACRLGIVVACDVSADAFAFASPVLMTTLVLLLLLNR